jgi:hypothetical protein
MPLEAPVIKTLGTVINDAFLKGLASRPVDSVTLTRSSELTRASNELQSHYPECQQDLNTLRIRGDKQGNTSRQLMALDGYSHTAYKSQTALRMTRSTKVLDKPGIKTRQSNREMGKYHRFMRSTFN